MSKAPQKYRPYTHYKFRAQDPVIDLFKIAKDENGDKVTHLAKESGVSASTFYNWFKGRTRKPQFATVAAAARSMGIEDKVALLIRGNRYR